MAVPENHLIALLPRSNRLRLIAMSQSVRLELGTVLCEPGSPTRQVYFPQSCCISLVGALDSKPGLEVGMVGSEGMLGVQLALRVGVSPWHAVTQGAGMARRVEAAPFRDELARSQPLQRTLNRYLYVQLMQLATGAVCTRFHKVESRLARWLLMSHDRAHSDSFHLTHEFLAFMLGVRRVGITTAAGGLQRRGLIRYHRGEITVLDRPGLIAAACRCYTDDLAAYKRQLG